MNEDETPKAAVMIKTGMTTFPYMPPYEQGWMAEIEVATMLGFARLIPERLGNMLEVGCWCGRTTAPLSLLGEIAVVDLFEGYSGSISTVEIASQVDRFWKNVSDWGNPGNIVIHKGDSHQILPTLKPDSYRFILVDGDHSTEAAHQDMNDCWRLLSPGGYMFVDDRDFLSVIPAIRKFLDDHPTMSRNMGVVSNKLGYFYKE
jgi:predicted O-methyltransferase YrrM